LATAERLDFEKKAVQRLQGLQARVVNAPLTFPSSAEVLREDVRLVLMQACRAELLETGMHPVSRLLSTVAESREDGRRTYVFSCGPIDFKRREANATNCLLRSDGAVLSFSVTLGPREDSSALELVAYRFDLTLPNNAFLRFDMDSPEKGHSGEGLRAHIHAGDKDVRLPSAVLHPLEALTFLLLHPRAGSTPPP
jgi:hypothetical protein